MAYRSRGLPSTGCNRCRSRKIKCDEGKPTCERCKKAGYDDCKFRDEFERTWRNNSTTIRVNQETKQQLIRFAPPLNTNAQKLLILPTNQEILSRFFHDWSIIHDHTPGMSISWFNGLRTMYSNAQPQELLYKSITALAHASYGRRFNKPKLLSEAGVWCVDTLSMLRDKLQSSQDLVSCRELKVSIILMGIFETLIASDISNSWMAHMSGAMIMLNMRAQASLAARPADFEIAVMIMRQMLHGCLMSGRAPLAPKPSIMQLFPKSSPHNHTLTEAVVDTVLLCARWKPMLLVSRADSDLQPLADIAHTGVEALKKLEQWAEALPTECQVYAQPPTSNARTDWLRPVLEGEWVPSCVHQYPTTVIRMLWRSYWVAPLILAQALLYTDNILRAASTIENPIAGSRGQVGMSLLSAMDRLCESCLSPLALSSFPADQAQHKDTIPSLEGYLLLQVLPVLGLSVDQVRIDGVDLSPRKVWIGKMGRCIKGHFGLAKASIEYPADQYERLPIQLWGLGP